MKAKFAAQIRAGIRLARMTPADRARAMLLTRHSGLAWRAYHREDMRVLDRMFDPRNHPMWGIE